VKILFWIVSLGLVAFEMAAGIGKQLGGKMALDWMNKLGVAKPFMSVFGGLEVALFFSVFLTKVVSMTNWFLGLVWFSSF